MTEEKNTSPTPEKGALLTTTLVFAAFELLLIMLAFAFLAGDTMYGEQTWQMRTIRAAMWVIAVLSIYWLYGTFKMRKKAACCWLGVMAVWSAIIVLSIVKAGSLQQASILGLIMLIFNIIQFVVIGKNLKRMV